jgi:hypothetical protein
VISDKMKRLLSVSILSGAWGVCGGVQAMVVCVRRSLVVKTGLCWFLSKSSSQQAQCSDLGVASPTGRFTGPLLQGSGAII